MRETKNGATSPEVIIIDLQQYINGNPQKAPPVRRPIKADNAIMHWNKQIIALKAQGRTLQIFDLGAKSKLKSATMNEDIVFWKWFSESSLGLVTDTSVYHWDVFDQTQASPVKIFERNTNLSVCSSFC